MTKKPSQTTKSNLWQNKPTKADEEENHEGELLYIEDDKPTSLGISWSKQIWFKDRGVPNSAYTWRPEQIKGPNGPKKSRKQAISSTRYRVDTDSGTSLYLNKMNEVL